MKMKLKKYGTWATYVEEVLSWFAAGPSKDWTQQRRRERAYAALCQYHCDRRHEAEVRGKLAAALSEKDARIAELEGERDALRHSESLIQADLGMFKTDCSTPTFQLARNAVKRIAELEAAMRKVQYREDSLGNWVCRWCEGPEDEFSRRHDCDPIGCLTECPMFAALPPQEEASE